MTEANPNPTGGRWELASATGDNHLTPPLPWNGLQADRIRPALMMCILSRRKSRKDDTACAYVCVCVLCFSPPTQVLRGVCSLPRDDEMTCYVARRQRHPDDPQERLSVAHFEG